jgi:hypothetical protein
MARPFALVGNGGNRMEQWSQTARGAPMGSHLLERPPSYCRERTASTKYRLSRYGNGIAGALSPRAPMKPIDDHRRPQKSPIKTLNVQETSPMDGWALSEGFGPCETRIGPAAPIRTMVINDSLKLLFQISRFLMAHPSIELIGITSDEDAVWDRLAALQPELILWTLQSRRTDRLNKITELRRMFPSLRILIIGADHPELVECCQTYGVASLIQPSRLRSDLWPAIQRQFTRPRQSDG